MKKVSTIIELDTTIIAVRALSGERLRIMLKYKVINIKTGEDITHDYDWVVSPNGDLNYSDYSDLIGHPDAKLVVVSVNIINDIP
jgi:hypothetical protein